MPVRGSLASLAMATTGCAPGHLKDANGVCRLVYVPEVLSPPTPMPPDDPRSEDQYQWGPGMEQMPPPPTMPPPTSPTPTAPSPTGYGADLEAVFPIDDPSWSTEISPPVRAYDSSMPMGGTRGISQHMADWILDKYPEQEMGDRYQISGWDVNPDDGSYTPLYNNPILSYSPEHNLAYLNSPEYKSYTESISGIPKSPEPPPNIGSGGLLIGGSNGITTPLPSIPSPTPMPMPMPIPDNSLPPPIEEYNSSPHGAGSADQFESYLQSLEPGTYTHEKALEDFLGRPPNAQELYMLDLSNNQFNMPVIDPGDNQYNMPIIDSDNWEPPPNDHGLLGIVGGGLVDQPIWDA